MSNSNSYIADTMALVLRLERRRLSQKVKAIFEEAENDNAGTAYSMEMQLLTNDPIISASKYISVVW